MRRVVAATLALLALAVVPLSANDPSPEALIEAGHWKRARGIVEQRLRANANDAQANYLMGRIKQTAGDADGALALAEKAVQLNPQNADFHHLLATVCGQKGQKAGMLEQFSLARRMKEELEKAIALDPKHIEARLVLMDVYMRVPEAMGGDKKKARALADEVGKIDASRGYLAQATIATRENQTEQLESLYRKAAEADPKSYRAVMALGNFYASDPQKKYDLAEKYARQALKLEPDRVGPYSILAIVFAAQQLWKNLDGLLLQAEKAVPDSLGPYYQAGRILLLNGADVPRAERYFRKYLTQEPEPNLPQHAHAWWRLGLVFEKQGRKAEAVSALETAVRLKPDLEDAKKDLERLK